MNMEEMGVSDMILLDPLTEDELLDNLRERYLNGQVYVSISFEDAKLNVTNSKSFTKGEKSQF